MEHGSAADPVTDNADGTYSQVLELPTSMAVGAELDVTLGGLAKSLPWPEPQVSVGDLFNWFSWLLIVLLIIVVVYVMRRQNP